MADENKVSIIHRSGYKKILMLPGINKTML